MESNSRRKTIAWEVEQWRGALVTAIAAGCVIQPSVFFSLHQPSHRYSGCNVTFIFLFVDNALPSLERSLQHVIVGNIMICSKNCKCVLCRELQTCDAKNRKINIMKKLDVKPSDNFILRKAEAFKPSGALGFIRGAARMSVRHWQNKERPTILHGTQPPRVSRAASCEQIFPIKINIDNSNPKIFKAPSCEQISKHRINDSKQLFKIINESKFVGKSQISDLYTGKDNSKGKRKREENTGSKNVHEKYIPMPSDAKFNASTYTEMKPRIFSADSREKYTPIYQDIKRNEKNEKEKKGKQASIRITQSKKQTTDLVSCFQEYNKKGKSERKSTPTPSETSTRIVGRQFENASQNNHRVVIYFGDSMLRNQPNSDSSKYSKPNNKEDLYAKKLLEETGNLGITKVHKTSATAELINQISIENEPIYSEITYNDKSPVESKAESVIIGDAVNNNVCNDDNNNIVTTLDDGVINIEFRDNFECARRWVDIINGKTNGQDDHIPESAKESLDWSFVQEWRKRPPSGSRNDVSFTASVPHESGFKAGPGPCHKPGPGPGNQSSAPLTRVHTPANVAQHHRLSKDLCLVSQSMGIDPSSPSTTLTHTHNASKLLSEDANHQLSSPSSYTLSFTSPTSMITSSSCVNINMSKSSSHLNSVSQQQSMIPERDTGPSKLTSPISKSTQISGPIKSVTSPSKLTVQSTPVKSQNPMISYGLEKSSVVSRKEWRGAMQDDEGIPQPQQHHHINIVQEVRNGLQRSARECTSSSDENRSSGHASMSDSGGGGGGVPVGALGTGGGDGDDKQGSDRITSGVTQRSTRSRASSHHSRNRHRATPAKVPWSGAGGLEDIRLAIQQLTLRSHTSTSTYSSLSAGSDMADGTGASHRIPRGPRLVSHSSLETVNTNVTSADEFVWVDSHNRLVELQQLPWNASDLQKVLHAGRCRDHIARISAETIPRVGYLLQRALVRIAREAHRLSQGFGLCSKHEIAGAFRIVLCPSLADSSIKACLRAATMFAVSGDSGLRQSKASRAALQLSVGKFHRWMVDVRLGRFIHEYAAIYLCAGIETLLEEIILVCMPSDLGVSLTPTLLEHAIAASGDLWGLLQPYAHLNAGRVASGALSMPRWASLSSIGSGGSNNSTNTSNNDQSHNNSGLGQAVSHQSITSPGTNPSIGKNSTSSERSGGPSDSWLLTTCVGAVGELKDLLARAPHMTPLTQPAIDILFYFMRCSQLEHSQAWSRGGVQELWYERAYAVLPPLVEWLRVAGAHADQRGAPAADHDDVMQAARLLLPGVDCPPRPTGMEECLPLKRVAGVSSSEDGGRAQLDLSFRLLLSGRADLIPQALTLLPASTGLNTINHQGLTALMLAASRNDEQVATILLDAGADPNIETPGCGGAAGAPGSPPPVPACAPWGAVAGWTALVYACAKGALQTAMLLLNRGAKVEGSATLHEDRTTLTPLQVACGSGNVELVQLLLSHGAHPFLSTLLKDSLCYSGSAQRGCYSAISVCCVHGQRSVLRLLLSNPIAPQGDVLSLEEMLAEGAPTSPPTSLPPSPSSAPNPANKFTKSQLRALQEAMYHSAETNNLDITLELRALGVSWSLHSWMLSLAAAADRRMDAVIDQLLQDFLQVCPDEYSRTFAHECLPLLFNIFRYSKKEGTTLLLADIFCTCYGWEAIKAIREPAPVPNTASRIDPKYVNNPELSDVTFRVEGRLFYGHKIVLVTASPRFRAMLTPPRTPAQSQGSGSSTPPSTNTASSTPSISSTQSQASQSPIVQINDIRYHIFQLVMQFLYSGGCNGLEVPPSDVLELLAAASFFQLLPLQRYCEARCAQALDLHNVVNMYIHAKVYNAVQLLEYCQGFLLQNMVALLTYDDSVKRLLFGKRLPGHDVLGALLTTLQQRSKAKRGSNKGR